MSKGFSFLAVDAESTGPDPLEARIIELGFQEFANQQATKLAGAKYYNPGFPIPKSASDVNGITDAHVKNAPRFAESAEKFSAFLKQRIVLGYNFYSFDGPLIKAEAARAKVLNPFADVIIVDVYPYVKEIYPFSKRSTPKSKSLKDQCVYFGIGLNNAHSALADSKACGELFLAMQTCKLIPMDLAQILADQEALRAKFMLAEQTAMFDG